MAGARSLWRANGMKKEQFGMPVIGIANSFTQFVPGHGHLHEYRNQLNGSVRFNYKLDFLTKGLSTHATISYQNYNTHTIRYVKNMVTYKLIGDKNNPIFIPQG